MIKINKIEKDSDITFLALVSKKHLGVATNGKKYLTLELIDATGSVDARLWDADNFIDSLNIGQVYEFKAFANNFRNNLQLKIMKFKKINEKDINWSDFIKEAPINENNEYKFILDTVKSYKNVSLKNLISEILIKYEKEFKIWPAATKFHHNVRKGLIWHTSSMLKVAKSLPKIYSTVKNIDYELLFSGIILHDLGKIIELEINGGVYNYGVRGKLVGHISIMASELNVIAKKLKINNEYLVLLEHLILASHGKLEYGSPVLPSTIEAEILWLLDNLDARIFSINEELEITEENSFSNKLNSLEKRNFYKHIKK